MSLRPFRLFSFLAVFALALSSGCGGGSNSGDKPTSTVLSPIPTQVSLPPDVRLITEPVKDILYNRNNGKLYVSTQRWSPSRANSIVAVDPATGKAGATLSVGSQPGVLTLSEDGKYLYVGLDGENAIRRVNLPSGIADQKIDLGRAGVSVTDMSPVPGKPGWLVVADSRYSSSDQAVALFSDGILRYTTSPFYFAATRIAFGATADRLYGYDYEETSDLFRYNVTDQGISQQDARQNIILRYGPNAHGIHFDSGRLYADSGQILDGESGEQLGRLDQPGAVCPDVAHNRIYVANMTSRYQTPFYRGKIKYTVFAYDATQLKLLATRDIELPDVGLMVVEVRRLITWGHDGLVFCTEDGRAIILDHAPSPQ